MKFSELLQQPVLLKEKLPRKKIPAFDYEGVSYRLVNFGSRKDFKKSEKDFTDRWGEEEITTWDGFEIVDVEQKITGVVRFLNLVKILSLSLPGGHPLNSGREEKKFALAVSLRHPDTFNSIVVGVFSMEGEEVYRIKVKLEFAEVVDYDPVSVYNCLQFDSVFSTPGESPGSWSFRFSSFSENNLDDCGLELKNLSKKLGKTKAKFCDKIFGSNAFGDLYIEVPKNGKELRVMKMGRQKSKTDISVFSEEEFTSFFMPDGSVCCLNFYHKRGLLLSSDLTRRTNFEITILGRRNCDYFFTPEGIVYLTTNYGVNSLFSSRWVSSPGAILAPEE